MATTAKSISPTDGAMKVLGKVRKYLPQDARWDVEYFDDDGVYLLNIFADGVDRMKLHEASAAVISELNRMGLPMAMVLDGTLTLETFPSVRTNSVHSPTKA